MRKMMAAMAAVFLFTACDRDVFGDRIAAPSAQAPAAAAQ